MDLDFTKEILIEFINKIKTIKADDYNENKKSEVYLEYKEVYKSYSKLKAEVINENFTRNEIQIINCLKLGEDNEKEFNQLILKIQSDSHKSILGVADFIKSRAGFDLINKNTDFEKIGTDKLVEIFGGLFGVQIAEECIKSLRAEKVGRIIGYALSEKIQEDILEFKQLQNIDFCDFLKKKIEESDVECSYSYDEHGSEVNLSCSINKFNHADLTSVRGRNRVDHCFVNDEKKTIVFGQSTSNKDSSSQGYSYFKGYIALKYLVNQESINDEKNPYYGYKLQPYLMLGGRLVADEQEVNQEKGRDFKKMLPNINIENLTKIAQLQYFRFYGNAVNMQQVNCLPKFNAFIAGCDTINLYELSERMELPDDETTKNKILYKEVITYLKDICTILNQNDISFTEGGKVDLLLTIKDIENISKNLFLNFNFKLTKNEYAMYVEPLYESVSNLVGKLSSNPGQYEISAINSLRKIYDDFSSLENYNKEIASTLLAPINKINWIEQSSNHKNIEIVDAIDINYLVFIPKLGNELIGKIGVPGKKFLIKYNKIIDEFIHNDNSFDDVLENQGMPFANKPNFWKSLYSACDNLNDAGHSLIAEFIEKSHFLVNGKNGNEKFNASSQEFFDFLNKKLLPAYPELLSVISIPENIRNIKP